MYFERLYDPQLAQASYLVGCQRTGEAVVVDPNRDVRRYVEAAAARGLRVTHVTETHIHADFVSGARALARHAGAQLLLSDAGGADGRYTYAAEAGARPLRDGEAFAVGDVRLDVLHTPGHTPEHLSFVVTDTSAGVPPGSAGPFGVLTGDFVFAGDVGRPDLLERAAGRAGTMAAGARALFRSLARFRALPDHLQVWPGHGAGSACGKALGAVPASTVGYEKVANWGVAAADEAAFVDAVLAGQPEPPRYFAEMKRVNAAGPRGLAEDVRPPRVSAAALDGLLAGGAAVAVDTRPAADYAAGHVPGTVNIPLGPSFATWAGSLLPYDRDLVLLAAAGAADEARRVLALVGLDRVTGVLGPDALEAWAAAHGRLAAGARTTPAEAAPMLARGDAVAVDVRGRAEWDAGHLPGAIHLPLVALPDRAGELPAGRPLVVHCQGGARSAVAASVLRARGAPHVLDLVGGYAAWRNAGLPTTA